MSVYGFGASVSWATSPEGRNGSSDRLCVCRSVDVGAVHYFSLADPSPREQGQLPMLVVTCRHDWEQDLGRDNVMSSVRPAVKTFFNTLFGSAKGSSDRS